MKLSLDGAAKIAPFVSAAAAIVSACIGYQAWTTVRDNFQRGERAWVLVSDASLREIPTAGKTPLAIVKIINSGKTPAFDVSISGNLFSKLGAVEMSDFGDHVGSAVGGGVFPPGPDPFSIVVASVAPATESQVDAFTQGPWILYVVGFIQYRDVFGASHRNRFCLKSSRQIMKEAGLSMTWCPNGNSADY